MFLVSSSYLKSRAEIETLLVAQAQWLKTQHDAGTFVASGCNLERTSGTILVRGLDLDRLEALLASSPFAQANAARYAIVEIPGLIDQD